MTPIADPAPDLFGTGALRAAVLDGWGASAARFREDANAEEDLVLGGYRDRLVVELAQNAADAAARAGVSGRLLLTLAGDTLTAANTGAPLDASGVSALATLRASAKRDGPEGTVGRFGVGFAAVLAVTDEPSLGAGDRAVGFSRARTADAVTALPGLADELAARAGHVPVLRLPWPARVDCPDGYDTAVRLPLRDAAARTLARRLLDEVGPALLLVLPSLREVVVVTPDGRRVLRADTPEAGTVVTSVDGDRRTWRTRTTGGPLPPDLLRDRPSEERLRPSWTVTCAVALDAEGTGVVAPPPGVPAVLHAPTPTDEPLGLGVLVVATLPLEPSRRHVAPGPLADTVTAHAADAVVELVAALARDGVDVSPLVPGPFATGAVDGTVRHLVREGLRGAPLLPAAEASRPLLRAAEATVLDGAGSGLAAHLAGVVDGLVAPGWPRAALDGLKIPRVSLADVVDDLAGLARPAAWWRELYDALDGADSGALSGLPVPLADGRMARGPRGLVLGDAAALGPLRLRIVDPDAAHPLLERLGAVPASPAAILADPAVVAAVGALPDEDDPGPVVDAVLSLLGPGGPTAADLPWLGGLLLPDEYGDLARADELVLPGSPAAALLAEFPRLDAAAVERWGAERLTRAGVLATLGMLRLHDVGLDPDELDGHDVDGLADWAQDMLELLPPSPVPALLPALSVVRDLDYVADDAWPAALELLAQPPLRDAVTQPVRVVPGRGAPVDLPAPTAWWLRDHALLAGRPAFAVRIAGADQRLDRLYASVELPIDHEFLRAIGVRTTVEALLAEPGGADELLEVMVERELTATHVRDLWAAIARADGLRLSVDHEEVRVPLGAGSAVVDRRQVTVAGGPWELATADDGVLVAPSGRADALAALLGLPAPGSRALRVDGTGTRTAVPQIVTQVLPGAPSTWWEHEELRVGGREVDWWVQDGEAHAATTDGLARGLAWIAGSWRQRWLLAAVLTEPERMAELLADAAFDP